MDDSMSALSSGDSYQRARPSQRRHLTANTRTSDTTTLPGPRPVALSGRSLQLPVKLGQYPVPDNLRDCLYDSNDPSHLVPVIKEELNLGNYSRRFAALLHLEEVQEEIEIHGYDMDRVCLRRFGEYLALRVPGLAEGRPSLLVGDKIILTVPAEHLAPQYEGYVHELMAEEVLLKFHESFHAQFGGEDYNVSFSFNRTPMRRCHQVVGFAEKFGEPVLFPEKLEVKPSLYSYKLPNPASTSQSQSVSLSPSLLRCEPASGTSHSPVKPLLSASDKPQTPLQRYNISSKVESGSRTSCTSGYRSPFSPSSATFAGSPKLTPSTQTPPIRSPSVRSGWKSLNIKHKFFNSILNDRQKSAVLRILAGQCRPSPYILFGPPGTGKTVTVVEAILQVLTNLPSSRILACAPSNSATDLLAERLIDSGQIVPGSMVRLNAFRRTEESIPDVLKPYSDSGSDLGLVSRHRLVLSTCTTAASLYSLALPAGHFTHAFIDEAGQATEPECLCAVNLVAVSEGVCTLAGDPMQLGPVLRSKIAKSHGLQMSYLERLMSRRPYLRDADKFSGHGAYDPLLVTKLVKNYRSHPVLLSLPSQLFYHDELEVCADLELRECLCGWDMLPSPRVPLIFHGVRGEDMREGDSPSWFNAAEAVQVMRYLKSLVHNDSCNVGFHEIGIVTPYRKQVEKIRLLIDKLGMDKVKVGSVEEFQGQERLVMIISLVRSDARLLGFDQKYNLGFLTNPKRFNVAITRPQALMIVLGNPHVLSQDYFWRKLLVHCIENGAYTGCDLPEGILPQTDPDSSALSQTIARETDLVDESIPYLHEAREREMSEDKNSTVTEKPTITDLPQIEEGHHTHDNSGVSVTNTECVTNNSDKLYTHTNLESEHIKSAAMPLTSACVVNSFAGEHENWGKNASEGRDDRSFFSGNRRPDNNNSDISSVNLNNNSSLYESGVYYGGARPKTSSSSQNKPRFPGSYESRQTRSPSQLQSVRPDNHSSSPHNYDQHGVIKEGVFDNEEFVRSSSESPRENTSRQGIQTQESTPRTPYTSEQSSENRPLINLTDRGKLPGSYTGPKNTTKTIQNNDSSSIGSNLHVEKISQDSIEDNRRKPAHVNRPNHKNRSVGRYVSRRMPPNLPPRLRRKYEQEGWDPPSGENEDSDSSENSRQSFCDQRPLTNSRVFYNNNSQIAATETTTFPISALGESRTTLDNSKVIVPDVPDDSGNDRESAPTPDSVTSDDSSRVGRRTPRTRHSPSQILEAKDFLRRQQEEQETALKAKPSDTTTTSKRSDEMTSQGTSSNDGKQPALVDVKSLDPENRKSSPEKVSESVVSTPQEVDTTQSARLVGRDGKQNLTEKPVLKAIGRGRAIPFERKQSPNNSSTVFPGANSNNISTTEPLATNERMKNFQNNCIPSGYDTRPTWQRYHTNMHHSNRFDRTTAPLAAQIGGSDDSDQHDSDVIIEGSEEEDLTC